VSSRARPAPFVVDHGSPEMVGEASFQASGCFAWGLSFVDLGFVVAATEAAGCADLGDGDGVEDGVELSSPWRDSRCRDLSALAISTGAAPA
jgi:hypothetical protein